MSLREQVLRESPFCIYCGGIAPATTIDHVPPRAVFDRRDRPRGLEFAACGPCNSGARRDELVAAMLSRVFPDAGTAEGAKEFERALRGVSNNCPGVLEEMLPTFRQEKMVRQLGETAPRGAGALNCRGPLLNKAITSFAAKIGYALHFQETGRPVPMGGAAAVWWLTNVQKLQGNMPTELTDLMGDPRTLRQGRKEVSDQFGYASVKAETGSISAHFATFRFSFAVCAFVGERDEDVRPPPEATQVLIFKPKWLQKSD